ncbi:hypothetical protein [uncultured Desulfuromonas sp.]|uniref:hypothetical protein n=1 Tax=uncultured Desulfuromonas sp. TaxID=181013 RepID=UPI002AAB4AA4|nr:hypothetical protein [uncultured Desulfuromonas sp.]
MVAILIVLLGIATSATAGELSLMLVVSKDNPQSQVSLSQLNRIFLGKTRKWEHGDHISLSINTHKAAMEAFCRTIIQKTPRQFSMYWRKQLYSGHSMLPAQFEADEQIINYVAEHSGAIGFILTPINDPRVKEIMIAP